MSLPRAWKTTSVCGLRIASGFKDPFSQKRPQAPQRVFNSDALRCLLPAQRMPGHQGRLSAMLIIVSGCRFATLLPGFLLDDEGSQSEVQPRTLIDFGHYYRHWFRSSVSMSCFHSVSAPSQVHATTTPYFNFSELLEQYLS